MVRDNNPFTGTWSNSLFTELCYNFRHAEENGRGRGDPWSLRQTGIYQVYDSRTQRAVWILLQPPSSMLRNLQGRLSSLKSGETISHQTYHSLHIQFLFSMESNWRLYLEHLWMKLDEIVSLVTIDKPMLTETGRKGMFLKFGQTEKV